MRADPNFVIDELRYDLARRKLSEAERVSIAQRITERLIEVTVIKKAIPRNADLFLAHYVA
jgi:hypothetical protein